MYLPRQRAADSSLSKHFLAAQHRTKFRTDLGEVRWLALMSELDRDGVRLDAELSDRALQVLSSVCKKDAVVTTWEQAHLSKAKTSLDDAKLYTLKRIAMGAGATRRYPSWILHSPGDSRRSGHELSWGWL